MNAISILCGLLAAAPAAPAQQPSATTQPRVRVETTLGAWTLELNAEVAPKTVINFLDYVQRGYYNGTLVHRVTENVIQGGGYTPDMEVKTDGRGDPIEEESRRGLYNQRYTIAMFRDPLKPRSTLTQFFINLKDNPQLDKLRDATGYAVFGKVVEGSDTIDKIAKVPVTTHPNYAAGRSKVVPATPIVILKMTQLSPLDRQKAAAAIAEFTKRAEDPLGFLLQRYEKRTTAAPVTTENGLIYLSLEDGTGAFPAAADTVELNFTGMLVDGNVFDSSLQRWNGPGKMEIATLLSGLREGLSMMREGGKALLVLPPALAFGEAGMPNKVPAHATVVFEVELLAAAQETEPKN